MKQPIIHYHIHSHSNTKTTSKMVQPKIQKSLSNFALVGKSGLVNFHSGFASVDIIWCFFFLQLCWNVVARAVFVGMQLISEMFV